MDSTENKPPEDSKLKIFLLNISLVRTVIILYFILCFVLVDSLFFSLLFLLKKCKKSFLKTHPTRQRIPKEAVHAELNLSKFHVVLYFFQFNSTSFVFRCLRSNKSFKFIFFEITLSNENRIDSLMMQIMKKKRCVYILFMQLIAFLMRQLTI